MNDDDPNRSSSSSLFSGGFVGFLNLPVGSTITFDGSRPVMLKRDDFVGFTLPPTATPSSCDNEDNSFFHLVAVRAAPAGRRAADGDQSLGVAVGFVLPLHHQRQQDNNSTLSCLLIRQYDPATEEVSSVPVDELTTKNLVDDVRQRKIQPHRVIDYDRLLSGIQLERWKNSTKFISSNLLRKRGLNASDKIVAGSYGDDDDSTNNMMMEKNNKIEDGKSIRYPCIPVMNTMKGAGQPHPSSSCRHEGTKRWLATKLTTPSQRTQIFLDPNPASCALELVLKDYYDNNYEQLLGDVQLAYAVFMHLHCYASLSHWRDLVAMLCGVERNGILQNVNLFLDFLDVLSCQLSAMEGEEFFDDADLSGGNFLIPSLQQLTKTLSQIVDSTTTAAASAGDSSSLRQLDDALFKLNRTLSEKFPSHFGPEILSASEYATTTTTSTTSAGVANNAAADHQREDHRMTMMMMTMMQDGNDGDEYDNNESDMDDEDDGPVVVPMEEFESSLARSEAAAAAELDRRRRMQCPVSNYPLALRKQYPVLFAAMAPTEDVLMTCARALDEASDVSLVREAAAYLENVEAKK